MPHDDLCRGDIADGDLICTSVVGAGPERGAYVVPVRVASVLRPDAVMAVAAGA
jgi:3-oxoacyl-[acyl-carrier-protein] synthase-3